MHADFMISLYVTTYSLCSYLYFLLILFGHTYLSYAQRGKCLKVPPKPNALESTRSIRFLIKRLLSKDLRVCPYMGMSRRLIRHNFNQSCHAMA